MRPEKTPIGFQKNIDKLLFILATVYLIFVTAWFLKTNKLKENLSQGQNPDKNPIVQEKLTAENQQKTVLNLDEQKQQNTTKTEPKSELASTLIINKAMPKISEVQPIPMPVPPKLPTRPSASKTLPISSPSPTQIKPIPSPSQIKPIKVTIPPPPQPQTISKVTSVPVLNSHKHKNSSNPEMALSSSSTIETINYNHQLVGLIELENQANVALFKTKDLTQRVKVGEEIGITGWILMAVDQKQAIVDKKGTVVRLTVGEKL